MFILNFKVNGSKVFKIFFTCVTLLIIFILAFVTFKVFDGSKKSYSACTPPNGVFNISSNNYTNVLKAVHDDIDTYTGKKINFTGFVYRIYDLKDNQFVLARNMIISPDNQYVVVGFLCEYDNIKDYQDGCWINITGEITKGNYYGDMPIIKINEIKIVDVPNDEFVYPPSDSYIPTSSWL